MTQVSPLLCRGIDDVLQRWQNTFKPGGGLNFGVYARINDFYRVVGATYPAQHPMRQNSAKLGEGSLGYFSERKVAGYVRPWGVGEPKEGNRSVFDRDGQVLGEVPAVRGAGILGFRAEIKWHYYRPVFEKSTANPWSDRVVGIVIIHTSADDGDSLFRTAEFQHQVDSIATEVSPYLDAIQVLTGEEKL